MYIDSAKVLRLMRLIYLRLTSTISEIPILRIGRKPMSCRSDNPYTFYTRTHDLEVPLNVTDICPFRGCLIIQVLVQCIPDIFVRWLLIRRKFSDHNMYALFIDI